METAKKKYSSKLTIKLSLKRNIMEQYRSGRRCGESVQVAANCVWHYANITLKKSTHTKNYGISLEKNNKNGDEGRKK